MRPVVFQLDDIIKNIYAAGDQTKQDETIADPDEDFGMKKITRENEACEDKKIFDPLSCPDRMETMMYFNLVITPASRGLKYK
jgi:hypothetical protein